MDPSTIYINFIKYSDPNVLSLSLVKAPKTTPRVITSIIDALSSNILRKKYLSQVTPQEEKSFFYSLKTTSFPVTKQHLINSIMAGKEDTALHLVECGAPISLYVAFVVLYGSKSQPKLIALVSKIDLVAQVISRAFSLKPAIPSYPFDKNPTVKFIRAMAQEKEGLEELLNVNSVLQHAGKFLGALWGAPPPILDKFFNLPKENFLKFLSEYNNFIKGMTDDPITQLNIEFVDRLWEIADEHLSLQQILYIFSKSKNPKREMAKIILDRQQSWGKRGPLFSCYFLKSFFSRLSELGWMEEITRIPDFIDNPHLFMKTTQIAFEQSDEAFDFWMSFIPDGEPTTDLFNRLFDKVIEEKIREGSLNLCQRLIERPKFLPLLDVLNIDLLMQRALKENQIDIFDYLRRKYPNNVTPNLLKHAIEYAPLEVFMSLLNQGRLMEIDLSTCLSEAVKAAIHRYDDAVHMQIVIMEMYREFLLQPLKIPLTIMCKDLIIALQFPEEHLYELFIWCLDRIPCSDLTPLLDLAVEKERFLLMTCIQVRLPKGEKRKISDLFEEPSSKKLKK